MKKNLLTFLFVVAFLCVGSLAVSAKNSPSLGNSVAASKRLSPAKIISNKIKALEAECGAMVPCASQLQDLIQANYFYEAQCAAGGYQAGCAPADEAYLLQTAGIYEMCLWYNGYSWKKPDRMTNRNMRNGSKV